MVAYDGLAIQKLATLKPLQKLFIAKGFIPLKSPTRYTTMIHNFAIEKRRELCKSLENNNLNEIKYNASFDE